jgi:integrase
MQICRAEPDRHLRLSRPSRYPRWQTPPGEARYGFVNALTNQPTIKTLFERRLRIIKTRHERIRAEREFGILLDLPSPAKRLPDVTTPDLQKFTEKRFDDVLQPTSISREWNIIAAAFNSTRDFFPTMKDWIPPSFPRPKGAKKKKRKRVIRPDEIIKLLTWFYLPQMDTETEEAARNRRTVGHAFQISLLTSARKGSLCQLRKTDVDLERETVKITDYYLIWKKAANAVGVDYGQKLEGGFRPHDARHTAATVFYRKIRKLTVVRGFTGHESDVLLD